MSSGTRNIPLSVWSTPRHPTPRKVLRSPPGNVEPLAHGQSFRTSHPRAHSDQCLRFEVIFRGPHHPLLSVTLASPQNKMQSSSHLRGTWNLFPIQELSTEPPTDLLVSPNVIWGHFSATRSPESGIFSSFRCSPSYPVPSNNIQASAEREISPPWIQLSNEPSPNPLRLPCAVWGWFYWPKLPDLGLKMAATPIQDGQTLCRIPKLPISTRIEFRLPGNVKSNSQNRSCPTRQSPTRSDQSSRLITVDSSDPTCLLIHADYIISRVWVIPTQCPLSQSETSDAHMLRFKLSNQSTSAHDIMPRHASCQLLLGRFPYDSSRLRTPKFRFSWASPPHWTVGPFWRNFLQTQTLLLFDL